MSEQNEHIEHLQTIRSRLVDMRRARAQYGAGSDTHENAADHIIKLQEKIRAIDEALNDEQKLAPSVYETQGIRSI